MTLELFPYQLHGAAFLAQRSRAGLFDDPGLGKSAQTIAALDMINADKVLIVCPAAVREVWKGEFKKFGLRPRRVLKGDDIHHLNMWLKDRVDVLLCSYEMATKWAPYILRHGDVFDAVVFDESHYLKSGSTKRSKALLGNKCDGKDGLMRFAARAWFLTGTPMSNDPMDIWTFLRASGSTLLNRQAFQHRYFNTRNGAFSSRAHPKPSMVKELKACIASQTLRRTQEDVGLELPPIWLTTQTVDGDTQEIRQLLREHPGLEKAVLDAVEKGGLSFLEGQSISTLRRLVGEAKAPAFLSLLKEELQNGDHKIVVMGVHRAALQIIRDGLTASGIDCVHIDGQVGETDRVQAVKQFQNDPDCRVFVGNIRAAGTGLTLTAASDLVLFESDWAPAANAQAIKRIHRIGQTSACRARFITLANSIDEMVSKTVISKTAAIAASGYKMTAA